MLHKRFLNVSGTPTDVARMVLMALGMLLRLQCKTKNFRRDVFHYSRDGPDDWYGPGAMIVLTTVANINIQNVHLNRHR